MPLLWPSKPPLVAIHLCQHDCSEIITDRQRLKKYCRRDFLAPQPYQQVLRVFAADRQGQRRAQLTSYHQSGQLWQYLEIVDGRACGAYREWHSNGKRRIVAAVSSGKAALSALAQSSSLFDGRCWVWDASERPVAILPYHKGLLQGTARYYCAGRLRKIACYQQHRLQSLVQLFDRCYPAPQQRLLRWQQCWPDHHRCPNCRLQRCEIYRQGKLWHGDYFAPTRERLATVRQGQGQQLRFAGEALICRQQIAHGEVAGAVTIYRNGRIASTHQIVAGRKQGHEIHYHGPQRPKLRIPWQRGVVQGTVHTWYRNGQMESAQEMVDNRAAGRRLAWYGDGQLMLVEEYAKGRLIKGSYFKDGNTLSAVDSGSGSATLFDGQGNFRCQISYRDGLPAEVDTAK